MGVAWEDQDGAERSSVPSMRIYRLNPGQRETVILLGDLSGIWLHWTGDNLMPCQTGSCCKEGCVYYPSKTRRRWYGPGMVSCHDSQNRPFWSKRIIELNDDNERVIHDLPHFGLLLNLLRGPNKTSPLICRVADVQPSDQDKAKMPAGFDVRPMLMRIWGIRDASEQAAEVPDVIKFKKEVG